MLGLRSDDIFDLVGPSIFRIETRWFGGGASATGFAVSRLIKAKRPILATAAHVLDFPETDRIEWTVQQFDRDGKVERELTVETTDAHGERTGMVTVLHARFGELSLSRIYPLLNSIAPKNPTRRFWFGRITPDTALGWFSR